MAEPTSIVQVNGAKLYCEMAGAGAALVLIHSSFCDQRMWDDQFNALAAACRVIRYDLRGFGKSDWPETPFSFVEDLRDLLGALKIERAVVLGLSLGAYIAIDFAIAYRELTAGLIVAAAAPGGYTISEALQQRMAMIFKAGREDADRGIQLLLDDPEVGYARQPPAARERLTCMFMDNRRIFQLAPSLIQKIEPPAVARLDQISAPTLIIAGELDEPDLLAAADLMQSRIAGAKKLVIQGAGHLSNMEKPAEFNRAVIDFMKSIS
jgi:pimeloyl-ACP methyl ester carboxylesterase